ncbi:MAG: hypothetical protein CVV33_08160 [Methanomicrobiales archaeon HGW-Methanomicrobiales-4]|nr:MAG: hypothetical protein CVV33_08160 [Methanomicrobiales archaeon HGW-Methanomicrobiales-4]
MKIPWQMRLGLLLICCSFIVYTAKIVLIDNLKGTIEYIFNSFGFLFLNVLVVTLVINELLSVRSRRDRMEKMNMVIGTFFSEVGSGLFKQIIPADPDIFRLEGVLSAGSQDSPDFSAMEAAVASHPFIVSSSLIDLQKLFEFLNIRREFMLRLLENPVLLEHQVFTGLLQATFHLSDELSRRPSLIGLSDADRRHLAGDISRVYEHLTQEWVRYLEYLKRNYPYLYSLEARTNPFDPTASAFIRDEKK